MSLAFLPLACLISLMIWEGTATTYIVGNIRVSVLTDRYVRLEYSNIQSFEDADTVTYGGYRSALLKRSAKAYTSQNVTTITTAALSIVVSPDDQTGTLSCANLNVTVLATKATWCPDMGLDDSDNLNGSVSTTDCYGDADTCLEAYQNRMRHGLLSKRGYSVYDETNTPILKDGWITPRPRRKNTGYLDWTFVESTNYAETLKEFSLIGGQIPMLPARAYSVWWSREWLMNATSAVELIHDFTKRNLPLNMLVLDMTWHDSGDATLGCGPADPAVLIQCATGYGGYNWNTTLFPKPIDFLQNIHNLGLEVMTNQHDQCGIDWCQDSYAEFAKLYGIDPASRAPVPCAFSNQTYAKALQSLVMNQGPNKYVDYYWEDYGLNGGGPKGTIIGCVGDLHCMQCLGDQQLGSSALGDNVAALWSSVQRVSYRESQGLRGMMLGVFGGLGHHRYGIVGSGDTHAGWNTLSWEIYASMTTANVLTAWTHDLGGFYDDNVKPNPDGSWMHNPEMFLRWIQFGCFSSFFRPHASFGEVRPWKYPNALILQPYWRLRSALFPYIYAAAFKSYQTSLLLIRPMYHDYSTYSEAYDVTQYRGPSHQLQYLFGDNIFVAPVTTPNATSIPVWCPPGQWISLLLAQPIVVQGPMWVLVPLTSQAQFVVFAKSWSVIPTRLLADYNTQSPNTIVLNIPWGTPALNQFGPEGTLHDDDGSTFGYQQGQYKSTTMQVKCQSTTSCTLSVAAVGQASIGPANRTYIIRLRGLATNPKSVTVNNGTVIPTKVVETNGGPTGDDDIFAHTMNAAVTLVEFQVSATTSIHNFAAVINL
eukprot:PhF_6_TR35350/c0_g1_i1/m.51299